MNELPTALAPWSALRQFVCWIAYPVADKPGKFDKFPVNYLTGEVINAQDGNNWTDATTALAAAPRWDRGYGAGAGFVFTEADPYFFLDIDNCLIPAEAGRPAQWSDLANEMIARLPGAAVEVSHSGKGLHVFGRYTSIPDHAKRNKALGLELYTSGRFVALTGIHANGSVEQDNTASIGLIAAQHFVPSASGDAATWTTEPVADWKGPADDAELIAKALRSGQRSAAAVFGEGDHLTFKDLWEADETKIRARWPVGNSEADQALANHLAFWTGKNCERMERLMRTSALMRPKWDVHRSYLGATILRACAFVQRVASGAPEPAPVVQPAEPAVMQGAAAAVGRTLRAGAEFMGPLDQLRHFGGCYYMVEQNRCYDLKSNGILTKAQFDVVFGGYLFVLDPLGTKTTQSAWDAFTISRVNNPVIVQGLCFRPQRAPGAVITEGGRDYVNTYVPYRPVMSDGDIGAYLDLLARQFPNERDRRIFINYLAHCVQRPGVKVPWWPVIQGVKGNGKSAHIEIMTYIVGEHYTHLPNAQAMARDGLKFNSWVQRKLFLGIEELSVAHKREFMEDMKVLVTAGRMSMEAKGVDAVTGDNAANGIICTNHKDALPIDDDERRYAMLWTAQQYKSDLARDGLDGDYFPRFYHWLREGGGREAIAGYLMAHQIEVEFDPMGAAHRAPETSSRLEAVAVSRGRAEQEILEAIASGKPGFSGGWVSSFYLDQLIDRLRANIPRNRRREMMLALGYQTHPALVDGRANTQVMPDGGKSVLYLRIGHLALQLAQPADVARAYTKAQEPGANDTPAEVVRAFG